MKKINAKTRTLLILIIGILVIALGITYFLQGKAKSTEQKETRASTVPAISSIPGGETSEKYQALQEEENKRKIEEAKKTGVSSVATIIGTKKNPPELFGIEGNITQCPPCPGAQLAKPAIPELEESLVDRLIKEIKAHPENALRILQENPGLARAIVKRDPQFALELMNRDPEIAKIFLRESTDIVKPFAEQNPVMFKKIVLSDPLLANQLAKDHPEVFTKMILEDPEFAKALVETNPELVKELMKNDPDFADAFGKKYPELLKLLMKKDPAFTNILAKNNPALVKTLLKSDPEFAKAIARTNPEMIKELMTNDPEFAQILAKQNPTLVKELMKNDPAFAALMNKQNPEMVKALMKDDPEFARIMERTLATPIAGLTPDQQRLQALEEARKAEQSKQASAVKEAQLNDLQKQQLAAILANMETQTKSMFQAWNEIPAQALVQGKWAKIEEEKEGPGGPTRVVEGGPPGPPGVMVGSPAAKIKAGTVLFAILDTGVNSDEPGPILATVVGGQLKGSKVVGSMAATPAPVGAGIEGVTLTFNTLNIPDQPFSIPINAVAIDPITARTALADEVDHHYFLRYGTMFAAAFMQGYAKVITSQGTTTTAATNGLVTQIQSPTLSNRQTILAALGEVGKKWGEAISTFINRPNTVTVESGTGFGLLFLADVQ